jgi:hypothetical protein
MASVYKIVGSTGGGGGGGGGSLVKYSATFNNNSDWGAASGGYYTLTVLEAIHEKGPNPTIEVYEASGGSYENVQLYISYDASGNVSLKVVETPDCRVTGKVVIF